MGSDFFNGGNADGGKIDIKAKTIKVDTGKVHIPQELRIRSRGTERHSASN